MSKLSNSSVLARQVSARLSAWRWWLVGSAVGLAVLGVIYAVWIYSEARDVERILDRAEALDVSGIATGDTDVLAAALQLVEESERGTDSLSGKLGPVRVSAAVLGWVPWVGDQLRASNQIVVRAQASLDSTGPMVAAAEDLLDLRQLLEATIDGEADNTAAFNSTLASLEANTLETSTKMAAVEEAIADMGDPSLLGVFQRRLDRLESLENRLFGFRDVLDASPAAIADARLVVTTGTELSDSFGQGSGELDLNRLAELTRDLATAAESGSASSTRLNTVTVESLADGDLSDFTGAMSQSIEALAELSEGLSVLVDAFAASGDILAESNGSLLEDGATLQLALRSLADDRTAISTAVEQTIGALDSLRQVLERDGGDFLPPDLVDPILQRTERIADAGRLMSDGPELLLGLMGADGPRKYLVLGQTSDELRAAGGFTSSAWTLEFDGGGLVRTTYLPILQYENPAFLAYGPPPPEPLSFYMNTGALYLRDVGWSPDFRSVATLAMELHELHRGSKVDGVISVTQWGIIRLVEALGGIEVDGELVSPEETLRVIELGTDAEGTEFLERLFTSLLTAIDGMSLTDPDFKLISALDDVISKKDVMFFSTRDAEQQLIEDIGMSGRFPLDGRDRLAVIDSNVGWSKSDRSIDRSARYVVDLSDPANPAAELTLSYQHTGSDVGRDCSSHSPPTSDVGVYSISINSCYWNYFRVYTANGSTVTNSPALPLPASSIPTNQGRQAAGTSTFSAGFDEHGSFVSGLVAFGPGESVEFTISYDLPATVTTATETGFRYELALIAQPGARGRDTVVEVLLPEGYEVNEAGGWQLGDGRTVFDLDLLTDVEKVLELTPSNSAAQ